MKKLTFKFLLICLLVPLILKAQWIRETTPEWSEDFKSVCFVDSLTGYLTGKYIYKTTNAGKNWNRVHNFEGNGGGHGMFFMNPDTGWVTGSYGTVKTIDGGKNWKFGSTPWFSNHQYTSLYFINSERGIMVSNPINNDRTIWNTYTGSIGDDDAFGWYEKKVNFSTNGFFSVNFANFTTGWIVGEGGQIIKTKDSGYSWFRQNSGSNKTLHDVEFLNANLGIAVGEYGTILRTTNSGETWTSIASGVVNQLNQIQFIDSERAYIVGTSGVILKTIDGGNTWSESSNLTTNSLTSLSIISNNHGYAVGNTGELLRYVGEAKVLKLLTPNGGENVRIGEEYQIEWFSNSIRKLSIEFSSNNGASWETIVSNYDASSEKYLWRVSEDISKNCIVRIKDSESNVFDESDNIFTISKIQFILFEPIGSEELIAGNYEVIRWENQNADSVNIEFSLNNGASWEIIAENISASNKECRFLWKMPEIESNECKIRITDFKQSNIFTENYTPFKIKNKNTPLYIWENIFSGNNSEYNDLKNLIFLKTGNYLLLNNSSSGTFVNNYSFEGSLIDRVKLDDYYSKIIESSDGNFFAASSVPGLNESEPSYGDISLSKLNQNYELIWTTSFPIQGHDYPIFLKEADDGIIIGGYAGATFGEYARAVVIKTDKNGNKLWENSDFVQCSGSYGNSCLWSQATSCIHNSNGSYIVLGSTKNQRLSESNNTYRYIGDVFATKFNSNGRIEWNRTYKLEPLEGYPYWDEVGSDIDFDGNGYTIVGSAKPYKDYNISKNTELFLLKISEFGNKTFSTHFNIGYENLGVNNLVIDNSGNYLVSAYNTKFFPATGNTPFVSHLVRINTDGSVKNIKSFNIENTFNQRFSSNAITANGDYILSGTDRENNIIFSNYADESTTPVLEEKPVIVKVFYLSQNYPNPFNPSTVIKYSIPINVKGETANVKLIIFDVLGKEVATLVNKEQSAGSYEVEFQAKGLSSGVYFYTLRAGNFNETKKMLLLR